MVNLKGYFNSTTYRECEGSLWLNAMCKCTREGNSKGGDSGDRSNYFLQDSVFYNCYVTQAKKYMSVMQFVL
jgi:hypothetical protein